MSSGLCTVTGGENRALPPGYDRRWLYTVVALDDDEGFVVG